VLSEREQYAVLGESEGQPETLSGSSSSTGRRMLKRYTVRMAN